MYADRRLRVLLAITFLLLGLAGLRSVWFALAKADSLSGRARGQQVAERSVLAPRGDIVDRRGVRLAVAEPAADVSVNTLQVPANQRQLWATLISQAFGMREDEVLETLNSGKGFARIGREVPDTKVQALKDRVSKLNEGRRTAMKLSLSPFTFDARNRRVYPGGSLAGQLLGTWGVDDKAQSGLELALDKDLRGTDGKQLTTRSGLGETIRIRQEQAMTAGKDVSLTLDASIQTVAEEALDELGTQFRPKRATAIVMRPGGQILAMANWPRVNPSNPSTATQVNTQNAATSMTYEPGSTFKAITVGGALQDRTVTPRTQFTVPYQIQVADRLIHDAEGHGTETMTPSQILAQSSNVGAIKVGMATGAKRFDQWMRKFGFGQRTKLGLGDEQGLLLPLKQYSGSTMGNLPIGQGQLVTPMQMADAYATIANGGVKHDPALIQSIGGKAPAAKPGRRILRPEVAKQLQGMLTGVFEAGGTASAVKVPGYALAGKTGTSNVFDEKLKEYAENRNVTSVAGFAPAKNPKLVIVVVADEPAGGGFGATVAGPTFAKIARFALQNLQIPPTG